ncbi:MAG TPA: thioredoxin domain-containing protein [Vicinamibacteria bacterium]|nr:thioredoxin domain-containing protein [Vicinamibacteria bacterium]
MLDSKRLYAAIVLLLLGTAVSGVLLLQHHGEPSAVSAVGQVCGEGETSGCDRVAQSAYARIGGVPLAAVGVAFYLSLACLALLATQAGEAAAAAARLGFVLLVLALAIDVALLGVQAFAIGAFCRLCILTYALNVAALYALWPARRAPLLSAVPAGRLLGLGWGLASLASVLFALAWNAGLSERAERRAGAVLGAAAAPGDAAEVQRLKAILDDPKKYEEYLQQKSIRDFEAAKVQDIALQGVPFKGDQDARIKVVEYSDFLCPFCRAIAGAFRDYIPQAQGRVSVHFKNYPLDKACNPSLGQTVHPGACLLAQGAICAGEQGRFWEFHDQVFTKPPQDPGRDTVLQIASAAGLDAGRLGACLDAPGTQSRLQAEIAEAHRLGVNSTPSVFINGKRLPRINDFLMMVDKEGARLGLPPLARPQGAR